MQVLADSRNCCNNHSASHPNRFPAARPAQSSSNISCTSVVQPLQERDGWAALGTLCLNPPCTRVLKPQTETLFQTLFQRIQSCQKTKSSFHGCAQLKQWGSQPVSTMARDSAAPAEQDTPGGVGQMRRRRQQSSTRTKAPLPAEARESPESAA